MATAANFSQLWCFWIADRKEYSELFLGSWERKDEHTDKRGQIMTLDTYIRQTLKAQPRLGTCSRLACLYQQGEPFFSHLSGGLISCIFTDSMELWLQSHAWTDADSWNIVSGPWSSKNTLTPSSLPSPAGMSGKCQEKNIPCSTGSWKVSQCHQVHICLTSYPPLSA